MCNGPQNPESSPSGEQWHSRVAWPPPTQFCLQEGDTIQILHHCDFYLEKIIIIRPAISATVNLLHSYLDWYQSQVYNGKKLCPLSHPPLLMAPFHPRPQCSHMCAGQEKDRRVLPWGLPGQLPPVFKGQPSITISGRLCLIFPDDFMLYLLFLRYPVYDSLIRFNIL